MLRKRIIFTLIYENGFFNQSRNFRLQKVGNLRWLEKNYKFQDIAFSLDELIVLNASKNDKNIADFARILNKLVDDVFIPIAAGGGIRSLGDAKMLFDNGADKIVLNTILHTNKNLVQQLVSKYGSQSIVASIDYKANDDNISIYIKNGTEELDIGLEQYIKDIEDLKVGEVYLNSIDKDGTGFGYEFGAINKISKSINVPLIIAGGAGNEQHLITGLEDTNISAVATANLFNFIGDGLPNARKKILEKNINVASWN
ncbi:MAG TPA: imidazole glycerol phosphate synthase subunit HisF [Crocinitomix sp.]|nr:imidazole glycerol phosphate synthase subunit HisF [Crocinitomix sp.]